MTQIDPKELIRSALAKGELAKLLLGSPGYCYLPTWTVAPGKTDLVALLEILYSIIPDTELPSLRNELLREISAIVRTYEGIDVVATIILFESGQRADSGKLLDLPLDELATQLRQTIKAFAPRLRVDQTGRGAGWPDGQLGDLRRRSKNTVDIGGPSFCE